MRLVVFGPTGGTGRQLLDQAAAQGHQVVAVARRPEALGDLAGFQGRVEVIAGDVLEPEHWRGALDGADAVVSALGIGTAKEPTTVYSAGVGNIIDAMGRSAVRRLSVISASIAEPREDWPRYGWFRARVLFPILNTRFGASYDDMRRMERLLRATDLDWTVYRPPYLTDGPRRGRVRMAIDEPLHGGRSLPRADLAAAMLAGLADPSHRRAVVELSS